jgi:outer membrane receptor protein involved in Fe transport
MKLRPAGVVAGLVLVWSASAWAADPKVDDEAQVSPQQMEGIEVHGRKAEDPVLHPLAPPRSQELTTATIPKEELELSRPRNAAEALNYSPSFQLKRKGRKNALALTIRGAGNANVLLDGIHLGTKEDIRFVDYLPTSLLQDIVVIRDSTGLLYGPPQLSGPGGVMGYGGVIDFRLLDPPKEGHHGELRAEIGRFNENLEHLHLAGALTETLGYVISADRDATDGPDDENMAHAFEHFLARFVWHYWDASTLTLNILREDGTRELQKAEPGTVFTGWIEEYDPWRTTVTTLALNHVWTDDISTRIEAYYRDMDATYTQQTPKTHVENDLHERKKGVVLRQTVRLPEANVLRLGGSYAEWDNPTGKLYYMGMERREEEYSLFLQDELTVLPDRLTVDAGVRWDRSYLKNGVLANGPGFVDGKPVAVTDIWQEPSVSWSLGANLRLTERQNCTARLAVSRQSARSDTISQSGESLDGPEETRAELGYHICVSPQLDVTVTGFWTTISDGLVYDGPVNLGGTQYASWTNADLERLGVEFMAEGKLTEKLGYFVNALWMNATKESGGAGEDHDDKVPRWLAGAGLRYLDGAWRGSLSAKYTTEFQDDFGTKPRREWDLGDYWLMDANVAYVFTVGNGMEYEIYGGVRNAFNEHYETFPGFSDPGVSLYVGGAVRW